MKFVGKDLEQRILLLYHKIIPSNEDNIIALPNIYLCPGMANINLYKDTNNVLMIRTKLGFEYTLQSLPNVTKYNIYEELQNIENEKKAIELEEINY